MAEELLPKNWAQLRVDGAPDEALTLVALRGKEELSRLFSFTVDFEATAGAMLDWSALESMLTAKAYLCFGPDATDRIHGVLREIEALPVSEAGANAVYRALFVPKFWDYQLIQGSWIYQDLTPGDIISEVLTEGGMKDGEDFEVRLTGSYTPVEYKVQFEESDFQFISRVAEFYGIFYFWEHAESGSKLVFSDANSVFNPHPEHGTVGFSATGSSDSGMDVFEAISWKMRSIPAKVQLNDFNYRTPSVSLRVDQDVDEKGIGQISMYGHHYKSPDEGKKLARLRAQEYLSRKVELQGRSRLNWLRAGQKLSLEGHPVAAYDREYFVLSMDLEVRQPRLLDGSQQSVHEFRNNFVLLPSDTVFRPARTTPEPKIYGVMHAKIDMASDGVHAVPIDDQGRYKVLFPYDMAGKPGGKASRWCRMLQSASGPGYGMHMPLHGGTEVLIVHLQGDPDRPVIAGSVANPEAPSPVTSANATESKFATRHGMSMKFIDG